MHRFDKNSILNSQQQQINQLQELLTKETKKMEALNSMFETNKMDEKLLFSSFPCPREKPYHHLKNILSQEEMQLTREFYKNFCSEQKYFESLDYTQCSVEAVLRLPKLESKLAELFPNMMVFAQHWFAGEKDGAEYSDWHTGINIQKCFKGKPLIITVWLPLQDLNSETGGQLWFYNGPHHSKIIDVIRNAGKQNMMMQYSILYNYVDDLEQHKITENVEAGDALIFREIQPHSVDRNSHGLREILSVRLIEKNATIDDLFFEIVDKSLADEKFTFIETKDSIASLKGFCEKTRDPFLTYKNQNEADQKL